MQRLSKTGLYPKCFAIEDVVAISDNPVAAGGFADIYQGKFMGRTVCVKMFRVYQTSHVEDVMKHFAREAILWGQLSHPNLLPFYGLYRFCSRPCLVSPWVPNGDINEFLRQKPNVDRVLLALDLATGIQYLHQAHIIHGDLKGDNVLVDPAGRARVADFGLSAVNDPKIAYWTSHSAISSKGGTTRWQAPELHAGDDVVHNTEESDIYAWSCVCYEIFTGLLPFHEIRWTLVTLKVVEGRRPSRPLADSAPWADWGLTEAIWGLMEDCWRHSPSDRPVIGEVIARLSVPTRADERPTAAWGADMSSKSFRSVIGGDPSLDDVENILYEFA